MVKNVIVSGAFRSLTIRVASALALFGVNVLLAQVMKTADYGAYNFVLATVAMLALGVQFGFDKSAIRFIPEALTRHDQVEVANFIICSTRWIIVASPIAIGSVYVLLAAFGADRVSLHALWLGLLLLPGLSLLQFWQQVLRSFKRIIASQVFEQLIVPLGLGLATIIWVTLGRQLGLQNVLIIHILLVCAAAAFLWQMTRSASRSPSPGANATRTKSTRMWIRVSVPLGLAGLMSFVLARGEIVVLGLFLDAEEVARYSVALRISNLMVFGLAAANAIGGPVFSELFHRREREQLQAAVSSSAFVALIISLPVVLVVLLVPEQVLSLFGTEYRSARWILIILMVGNLVNVLAGPVGPLLSVAGEQRFLLKVVTITALLKILILVPAAIVFGALGAAWVAAVTTALWNIWLAFGAYTRLGVVSIPMRVRT